MCNHIKNITVFDQELKIPCGQCPQCQIGFRLKREEWLKEQLYKVREEIQTLKKKGAVHVKIQKKSV